MSKFYNVVSRKKIEGNTSDTTIFHKVGTVKVTPNGGWFLNLFHTDMQFQIFPNHDDQLPVIDFEGNDA